MKKVLILTAIVFVSIFILCLKLNVFNDYNGGKTVIKFSAWGSQSEISVLKDIISEYENVNPSVEIKLLHIPQNYFQKLHLLFASGLEPDVLFINNQYLKLYSSAGLLENLSAKTDTTPFLRQSVEALSDNGALFAIPRDISCLVVYYNKNIFSSAGISADNIKSFDDFINTCNKLKNDKYFLLNIEDNPVYWLSFISAFDGGILSEGASKVILNDDASISALNLYSDFINKYRFSPSKSQTGSMTPAQMFISGKLAMYFSGRWVVPKFRETISFDWDVFAFPALNGLYSDASGWAVSKNSKHKNEAIDFIKYLSSKEISEKFTESGLIIPARKDVAYGRFISDNKENARVFLDVAEQSRITPVNKNYSQIIDITGEKVRNILETGSDARDIIDNKTVSKINELIK